MIAALGAGEIVSLAVGALEVVLALRVLRQLGRFGRAFPWLRALMLLFVFRGLDRLYLGIADREEPFIERALADYRRLARHRLANRLPTILGTVTVLCELPQLDPATRA